jgi:GDP/UDP-N,N'-diacetylbacillosamine 2-epimerase (hydrolysing)
LAHVHFAASAGARKRLLRLGEDSFRIYQTGSPSLDNLSKKICKNISELSRWAGFDVRDDYIVILQHPAGGGPQQEQRRMAQTLRGCVRKGLKTIVLYPNCDPGFSGIIEAARSHCDRYGGPLLSHVPRADFLGLLTRSRALVGNSSAGIIEAGYLNVDVINVGPRQSGRERGSNVIDVDYGRENVARALEKVLSGRTRRTSCRIYGTGRSGSRIAEVLATVPIDQRLKQKKITY